MDSPDALCLSVEGYGVRSESKVSTGPLQFLQRPLTAFGCIRMVAKSEALKANGANLKILIAFYEA